jgi:hypothetical protein
MTLKFKKTLISIVTNLQIFVIGPFVHARKSILGRVSHGTGRLNAYSGADLQQQVQFCVSESSPLV